MERLLEQAYAEFENSNYKRAIEIYEVALAQNPSSAYAHAGLAKCFLKTENLSQAKQEIQKALELDSNSADIQNTYGLYLAENKQTREAILAFTTATEIAPKLWKSHFNLGIQFNHQKKHSAATKEFWLAFKYRPNLETINILFLSSTISHKVWYVTFMGICLLVPLITRSIMLAPLLIIGVSFLTFLGVLYIRTKRIWLGILEISIGSTILVMYVYEIITK